MHANVLSEELLQNTGFNDWWNKMWFCSLSSGVDICITNLGLEILDDYKKYLDSHKN